MGFQSFRTRLENLKDLQFLRLESKLLMLLFLSAYQLVAVVVDLDLAGVPHVEHFGAGGLLKLPIDEVSPGRTL